MRTEKDLRERLKVLKEVVQPAMIMGVERWKGWINALEWCLETPTEKPKK